MSIRPVQPLPIVERELKVAARQPKTWWRRVGMALIALVVFAFVYWDTGRWASLSQIGWRVFSALAVLGMIYSLLAGPLATVDCLSRERRDGTLGLLFLTDLRSYDVVFGKMAAGSFSLVMTAIAALPLFAGTLLLGGVRYAQFGLVTLTLLNVMFLSLAVGACISSFCVSSRAALGATLLTLAFLTFGIPILGDWMLGISLNSRQGVYYYIFCPLSVLPRALNLSGMPSVRGFWLNMAGVHLLSWICLFVACFRTRNSWKDLPRTVVGSWWQRALERLSKGSARAQASWRRFMIERNPVAWLEGRQRLQGRALMVLCLLTGIFLALKHLQAPDRWPDSDLLVLWPFWSHYILCLWLAIQAPRRFADDRQSGALELLLCTPTTPGEIVRGQMRILRHRFGRALLVLMAVDAFLVYAYCTQHAGWRQFFGSSRFFFWMCAAGTLVYPLQAWSFARVGLYQGLVQSSSLRATFMLVWKLGLLPWILWLGAIFGWVPLSRVLGVGRGFKDEMVLITWVAWHGIVCSSFLAHASWQLQGNFRRLAAQSLRVPWYRRLIPGFSLKNRR